MEFKISQKRINSLLSRTEIKGVISFTSATPSNKDLGAGLAKLLNAKPDLVAVKGIYTNFGSSDASFEAFVYDSEEAFKNIEPKIKVKKDKTQQAQQAPSAK